MVRPGTAPELADLPVGTRAATLTAEGYEPVALARLALVSGAQERRFVMNPIPRPLRVVVRDEAGAAVDAQVRLVGPVQVAPIAAAGGVAEVPVRPGTWQVLVSAGAYGAERRDVVVAPGTGVVTVDVSLARSRVEVTATGETRTFGPGDVLLVEDTDGFGHSSNTPDGFVAAFVVLDG